MYEQEIKFLKALANGVNCFTGEKCDNGCILNDADVVRTLYKVCDVLENVVPEKLKKFDFVCPSDIEQKFEYENELSLSKILGKISDMYPESKKLKYKDVAGMLINKGILQQIQINGQTKTVASALAENYGIFNTKKQSAFGQVYEVVSYNQTGQKFVLQVIKNAYCV